MKKKKLYDWHFWMPEIKVQIVVTETCYSRAIVKMKDVFQNNALHSTNYKFEFQFGQKAFKI